MDKIKALFEKTGVKPELAAQICETLEQYKVSLREQYDEEYSAKIQTAKKICVEEVEAHKRELAKRLQIFCEAKGAAIEAALAKQSALRESEAAAKLRDIVSLLEGVQPSSATNGQTTADLEAAKRQIQAVTEARNRAVASANRANAIAEKALKRNRQLESKLSTSEAAIVESTLPKPRSRRIDFNRLRPRRPVSTRTTLVEAQECSPQALPKPNGHMTPADIASRMSEDLL